MKQIIINWFLSLLPYWNIIKLWLNSLLMFRWLYPFIIILLYLIKKYSDVDFYWLRIVTWEYWSWKTYSNSLENKEYWKQGIFIISNVCNSFVDLLFNSRLDLERIFTFLITYAEITNNQEFIETWFRPISFNIDEVHKYFFSRTFEKNINEENLMVITQLRKRSILWNLITQELAQLDVFFRRLTWWIIKRFYPFLWFLRLYRIYYVSNPEETQLEDETKSKLIKRGFYLAPNFLLFLNKNRRELYKEKWVSKIIVWFEDKLIDYTFTNFLEDIYTKGTEFGDNFWSIYNQFYWDKEFLTDFDDYVIVELKRKQIQKQYDEMMILEKEKKVIKYKFFN